MVKKVLFVMLIFILIFMISIEKTKQQDEILIASSMPQSSGLKAWGDAVFITTNSYFNYANDNNLIKDKKIVLKVLDDKYEPDLTYENITKLSKDDILAFYGIVGTPTNSRVISIIKESQIPYFAPFSGASFLRDSNFSNIVNFRASYKQEIQSLIDYVVNKKGLNKIAIFYQNDEYGEEGYISTLEVLKNKNISFISTGTYKRNTLSINHAFNEIKNSKPEVVIMIGASKASSLFIKKAKSDEVLKNVIFCNISFGDANSIVKELEATNTDTKNLIFSQIVPNYNDKSLKIVQEYQEIMKKYSNENSLGFISFEAFLASKVLVNQISKIEELGELNRKNLLNALKSPPKNILYELELDFKNNQLLNKTYLFEYENGNFKELIR
ncbi:ABC transporter substrate-binding protein [Aliarcobacter cryaerophilus]|uniref:ABC transporter substrate-binding protein n=1 Tax=Aliarcobacter cryaerophilus TaxID=28198 RepID=UPI0021B567DA|nr:ABC transporter substrate-binding protein [Aliarcobacter cryaerophilus]MCT7493041.1 ABC transporter substrate-binding protein [Aliarcobacter cryaerophilus]